MSELKNQKHVQMWCILSEPVGMSIIIINSRVFSAKNPTVNDASGVTMLFAEAGMIFGVPQNNNSVVNTEQFFSMSGNVKPGVDPEQSDYRTLRVERGTCFNPLQALITSPSADWMHLAWPIQAKIKTSITLFEKCKRIYGLKIMKSEFKNAGTLQLTGIRRIDGEL